jgi:hypothetical protein
MTDHRDFEAIADSLRRASVDTLPGHLGMELLDIGAGTARMRCQIQGYHHAPNASSTPVRSLRWPILQLDSAVSGTGLMVPAALPPSS